MKRILVIRFGALGDLLHMSPSLQALQTTDPACEIHLLTSPAYEPLLAMLPGIHRIWTWDKRTGWGAWFTLAQALRNMEFDAVVNLQPSLKTHLLTQWLCPQHIAVYRKQKFSQKGQAQRHLSRRHAIEDFYQPFLQLPNMSTTPYPSLVPRIPPEQLPPLQPKSTTDAWIGVIPGVGSKRSNRAWEPASYVSLIQCCLRADHHRVLLIGGPDEQTLAEQILQQIEPSARVRVENHCGQHLIPETARLLAQCDVVIGGDTGPIHLAAATGVPIIGIYGPTSLNRTSPQGRQPMHYITPPPSLACWPCEMPQCPYTGKAHLACMRDILVEDVWNAVQAILLDSTPDSTAHSTVNKP